MKNWNKTVPFPTDNYLLRIIDATFAPSKGSGKPMITLMTEIQSPDVVSVVENGADVEYNVAGIKPRPLYQVTKSVDAEGNVDAEKTATLSGNVDTLYAKLGLTKPADPENHNPEVFKNVVFWAVVTGRKQEKRKSPTAAQLAAGQKVGDVLTNPLTAEPQLEFYPEIQDLNAIYGVATAAQVDAVKSKRPF